MTVEGVRLFAFCSLLLILVTAKTENEDIEIPSKELSDVEKSLVILANLSSSQERVWKQQKNYEEQIEIRNQKEEIRQAEITKTLEEDRHLLKEVWATIKRKLKSLSKISPKPNEDSDPTFIRPKDCADLYLEGAETSGVNKIWPTWDRQRKEMLVYCDMETDGGGWTVLHRWGNYSFPSSYFRRAWAEYRNGFGDLNSAFWLGNDPIYALTSQGEYQLRIDSTENSRYYLYEGFWIEPEAYHYKLHVESLNKIGAADDILSKHNDAFFSTYERDPASTYCSRNSARRPGWWYSSGCSLDAMFTLSFVSADSKNAHVLKKEMKIRPKSFQLMKESS